LTGLALSQAEGEPVVRLTILGGSEEAAESFLSNLEDSPDFKDVAITNQGVEPGASAGGAVIVACTASYVGGSSAPNSR
jgi:hypothetical protein